jgi:hypothetical protein
VRVRKDSRSVEAKRKIMVGELKDTYFGGEEHLIIRRFADNARSSF